MSFSLFRRGLLVALAVLAMATVPVPMARYTQDKGPLVTEDVLFYAPTPPVRLQRVLTESAPTAALVVALPEGEVLGNSHKEAFFLRLIQIATRYVDVLVLINRDEPLAILKIKELIARHISDSDRVLKRVIFFRGMIDTEWVRDYGPLFGLGDDNRLVLLDNMYRDLRSEGRTERMLLSLGFVKTVEEPTRMSQPANPEVRANGQYLSDYGEFWRRNDDAAPLYFNEFLYLQTHRFSPLVRPPLELSGGDLAFTESGQMFTSTRTLELNGGEERRFSRLVREYFNVDHVSYLRPLPNSIWHIDMFFRIASPRVVMLGDFSDAGKSESGYLKLLHREAKEILEWNRVLIEERLPGVEVVRVPMPPIVQPNGRPASAGRTGIAELDSAIETTGARLKPLSTVVYRSFLNSVFINRGRGHSVVLVPTFSGLRGMESRVREAYHRAYPGADVHFINADALAEDFGGIHCVTLTIPALAYRPL